MVDQAFAAVENPTDAKVLDPACGAGIFSGPGLQTPRCRTLANGWKAPDTRTIQSILYHQLAGFDISEPALRLAALSLYITAIEINGTQRPPKELKFPRDLHGSVLFNFSGTDSVEHELGSLGPRVDAKLDNSFDLVIGNPPWTRLREEDVQSRPGVRRGKTHKMRSDVLNEQFRLIGSRVLEKRGFPDLAQTYSNPDKDPDLPFLWRAMEWAKSESGIIALAMPARIFARTTGQGHKAWQAVLRTISISGLLNGSDLRKSAVWDSMDLPFCLLFARNRRPTEDHEFYFSTPVKEPEQNQLARFRVDYESVRPIATRRVLSQPWILKALSLGTWRDVAITEQILNSFPRTVGDYWRSWDPQEVRTGQGYNLAPGLKQVPAAFLGSLSDFELPAESGFAIRFDQLRTFAENHGRSSAHMPRREALFQPPWSFFARLPAIGATAHVPIVHRSRWRFPRVISVIPAPAIPMLRCWLLSFTCSRIPRFSLIFA